MFIPIIPSFHYSSETVNFMVSAKNIYEELEYEVNGSFFYEEPLRLHTSLRIGGDAAVYFEINDPLSLKNIVSRAKEMNISIEILGGGTNVLFRDERFNGIIINTRNLNNLYFISDNGDSASLYVEAGISLTKLVNIAKNSALSGIEGLSGIPGSVGGAVFGNAGAFGYEIKDILDSITIMNRDGELKKIKPRDIDFRYRHSGLINIEIILSVVVNMVKGDKDDIADRVKGFLIEKREKQPIGQMSAGCVFKNPEGGYAGKLIEISGCKGLREGGISVSEKHANYFINIGGGTANDFIRLMDKVRYRVQKDSGIELEPEIRIIG